MSSSSWARPNASAPTRVNSSIPAASCTSTSLTPAGGSAPRSTSSMSAIINASGPSARNSLACNRSARSAARRRRTASIRKGASSRRSRPAARRSRGPPCSREGRTRRLRPNHRRRSTPPERPGRPVRPERPIQPPAPGAAPSRTTFERLWSPSPDASAAYDVPVPAIAFIVDALVVLVFAAVGRRSHAESDAVTGVLVTAWPFLTGLTLGWAGFAAAYRRAPLTIGDAVGLWVPTVAIGNCCCVSDRQGDGTVLRHRGGAVPRRRPVRLRARGPGPVRLEVLTGVGDRVDRAAGLGAGLAGDERADVDDPLALLAEIPAQSSGLVVLGRSSFSLNSSRQRSAGARPGCRAGRSSRRSFIATSLARSTMFWIIVPELKP